MKVLANLFLGTRKTLLNIKLGFFLMVKWHKVWSWEIYGAYQIKKCTLHDFKSQISANTKRYFVGSYSI